MGRRSIKTQRRDDLIRACIQTLHDDGWEGASLARIAKRAGLSAGLVAHYFGDKAELMEATMRHICFALWRRQADLLAAAKTPAERLHALISANLGSDQFSTESTAVWLSFWARVNHSDRLARIQRITTARLASNLRHALGALLPQELPGREAEIRRIGLCLAVLIDGLWLRAALGGITPTETQALALSTVDAEFARLANR